jgi:hypothetical protein
VKKQTLEAYADFSQCTSDITTWFGIIEIFTAFVCNLLLPSSTSVIIIYNNIFIIFYFVCFTRCLLRLTIGRSNVTYLYSYCLSYVDFILNVD